MTEPSHGLLARVAAWAICRWQHFADHWSADEDVETVDWLEDADRALVEQEPLRARAVLYLVALSALCLFIWASFAAIDQVTRGQGRVIPSQKVQLIQSLDGGVVTEIAVSEGDVVEIGQLLVRLDETRFASTLRENRAELMALKAKSARLEALTQGIPFSLPDDLAGAVPRVAEQELWLYQSSLKELQAEKAIAKEQLDQRQQELVASTAKRDQAKTSFQLASREYRFTKPLFASGAVSEVELLRLEREVSSLKGDRDQAEADIKRAQSAIIEAEQHLTEVELDFVNKQREQLSEVTARINALQETRLGLDDRVKLTAIRSPVRGTVKRLYHNTIGGVVLPGKEVIEVVPLDDTLLLEARITPKDIAFLHPGQRAMVKFSAYDFTVYGGLEAKLEHIGADTVMDEEGNPFYTVRVRTLEANLGDNLPIIPGMVAEVDIVTGKKTVLSYLMKPVLRAKEYALTER